MTPIEATEVDWCKLWAEWGTDPKVQMMSENMRCRHVMLLCLRCEHETNELSDEEVAFYMRLTLEDVAKTKELFIQKGFIDKKWNVLKWTKRQDYVSPAAKRMRAIRERERNMLRNGEYEPDSTEPLALAPALAREIDREIDREKEEHPPNPPTGGKRSLPFVLPNWIPCEVWDAFLIVRKRRRAASTHFAHRLVVKELEKLRDEGHDPVEVIEQSIRSGWTDVFPLRSKNVNGTHDRPRPSANSLSGPELAKAQAAERERVLALAAQAKAEVAAKKAAQNESV